MPATGDRVPTVYMENHRIVGLDPSDPIQVSYKEKVGTEPTGAENPELLKLKHTHGHDMTIVNGVGRIGWMTGGKAARWKDEDMADTFAKKAVGFIEQSKDAPFFLYFATHGIHVPRVPHPRFVGTSQAGTRGDAIQELDDTVGQVLAALDRLKLTENTLVIFTSDNGGVNDDGYEDFGPAEHALNGALRGTKGTLYEGGHRVPFIARWPGEDQGRHRKRRAHRASRHARDLRRAHRRRAVPPMPRRTVSMCCPRFSARARPRVRAPSSTTVACKGPLTLRMGQWKFIQPGGGGYGGKAKAKAQPNANAKAMPRKPQLFNLADDPAEANDLAEKMPEKVKEFSEFIAKAREAGRTRP